MLHLNSAHETKNTKILLAIANLNTNYETSSTHENSHDNAYT